MTSTAAHAPATAPDLAFSPLPGEELHRYLAGLRREGPVRPVTFLGQPAWLLTSHEAVAAAFRDERRFPPADIYRLAIEPVIGRNFQTMEGAEHRRYRALATPAFAARAVGERGPGDVLALAHALVDDVVRRGQGGAPVDLVETFTGRLPFLVIARKLGIPAEAEADFFRWALGMLRFAEDPVEAQACADAFTEYVAPIVAARRAEPQGDVISGLVQSTVEGQHLTDEEIFAHLRILFPTGAVTTRDGLGNLLYALLADPARWERVREDPSLRRPAIDEMLRWESSIAVLPRLSAPAPIEVEGVEITPGSFVLFGIAAAHRDPSRYPAPDRFVLDRRPRDLLSFGPGPRMCPGRHLAVEEMAAALDVLIERLPDLRLADEPAARPVGAVMRVPERMPVVAGTPA